MFVKKFGKSQCPQKFVNLSSIITNIKNKLTDVCGVGRQAGRTWDMPTAQLNEESLTHAVL